MSLRSSAATHLEGDRGLMLLGVQLQGQHDLVWQRAPPLKCAGYRGLRMPAGDRLARAATVQVSAPRLMGSMSPSHGIRMESEASCMHCSDAQNRTPSSREGTLEL